jgi:predicted RNA-binding protein with PUA-like domain
MAAKGKPAKQTAATRSAATRGGAQPAAEPSQFFTPDGGPWGKCFLPRAAGEKRYWLVKSEPAVFSWNDLMKSPDRRTCWDGVRNFAARNFMRDGMKKGDLVFFYHSMSEPQHIAGICEVAREAYADHTAFDKRHDGFDATSSPDAPVWFIVDLRAVESLTRPVTLPVLKESKALARMALLRIGRLSVTPVTAAEWDAIVAMGRG